MSTEVSRRRFLEITGGVVAGLAVGGATGYFSGKSAVPTPEATPTPTEEPKPEPIKEPVRIGVTSFRSGPYVSERDYIENATQIALEEIQNADWWRMGKIDVSFVDMGSVTPDEVKTAMEKLLYVDKVHIAISYWGTYGPGWDLCLETGIPLITGDTPKGVTTFIEEHPEIRLLDTFDPIGTRGYLNAFLDFLDWIEIEGLWEPRNKKMYVLHNDWVWDSDWVEPVPEEAEKRGWEIVGKDMLPAGTYDWSSALAKIRSLDPSVILHSDEDPADAGTFVAQFAANPIDALIFNPWGFAPPESIDVADPPDLLLGALWGSGCMGIDGPLLRTFNNKYKDRTGSDATIAAHHTYDSVLCALMAINHAASTDPGKIYDSLLVTSPIGLSGHWVFDPETHIELTYPRCTPNHIMQIQKDPERDGDVHQFNTVYPPEIAWRKFELPSWFKK